MTKAIALAWVAVFMTARWHPFRQGCHKPLLVGLAHQCQQVDTVQPNLGCTAAASADSTQTMVFSLIFSALRPLFNG